MPIYEYRCQACGHELEALQKLSDEPLTTCPQCEQESLNKLVSAAAFRLSGSGWYETDFKKDNKRNLAGDKSKEKTGERKPSGDKPADKKPTGKKAETA